MCARLSIYPPFRSPGPSAVAVAVALRVTIYKQTWEWLVCCCWSSCIVLASLCALHAYPHNGDNHDLNIIRSSPDVGFTFLEKNKMNFIFIKQTMTTTIQCVWATVVVDRSGVSVCRCCLPTAGNEKISVYGTGEVRRKTVRVKSVLNFGKKPRSKTCETGARHLAINYLL